MKSTPETDFKELQSLLRAEADQVPHCDLGDGFLDDFHAKLKASSTGAKRTSWFDRISFPEIPQLAWGGAIAATIVLGVFLGFSVNNESESSGLASAEESQHTLLHVSVDERIDLSGSMPTFVTKPLEF